MLRARDTNRTNAALARHRHVRSETYAPNMRAKLLLLLLSLLAFAACQPKGAAPAATPVNVPLDVPSFDADKIDLTFDWSNQPIEATSLAGAPIKLTASDGSGLELASLEARAVVYGPLAFTELHLAFDNREQRMREGTFSMKLPEGAAVSRFAMKIGSGWQEGEVVEREAARKAYEAFLHRNVDPAMLERDSGNVFRGRVYPILAGQRKEIIISYSHELPRAGEPYRLGLRGLPLIGQLDVQLLVPSQKKAFVLHRTQATPQHDFVWTPPKGTSDAVRGGRFAVVRAQPSPPDTAPAALDSVAVLVDASASRAATYAESVDKVGRVLGMLGTKKIKVACFDQEVEAMATLAAAKQKKPAGASDLGAALRWAANAGVRRVVLVTDGVPSTGPTTAGELASNVAALRAAGIERVDAIAVGGRRDETLLRAIAHAGTVVDGDATSHEAIAHDLAHAPRSHEPLVLANAQRTWQEAGLVFAEIEPATPLRVASGRALAVEEAPTALVERAVAQARIRELGKSPDREAARREIVELSTKHRVLSDYTAMLVLETENDYARFRIKRDALADILVVASRGVVAAHRNDVVVWQASSNVSPILNPRPPEDAKMDRDGDGIPDIDDKCPLEPETFNGLQDDDGCPDKGHVIIESNSIVILKMVRFRSDTAEILPESFDVVDAIATTMIHHPEFSFIELAGHTDERGDDATNLRMSQLRAEAVMKALIDRKVPKERLRARGYGKWCPSDPGHNEEAWMRNRRVEVKIVATRDGPTGIELGCENAFQHGVPRPPGAPRGLRSSAPQRWKATPHGEPLSGPFAEIVSLLAAKKNDEALKAAESWTARAPDDMLAWIAEGRALEALARPRDAARAYGSLLDLAQKPEHRRAAGGFLEAVSGKWSPALDLAIDAYRRAATERGDHPSAHRLLAHALARKGKIDDALDTTLGALTKSYDERRAPGALDVLRTDAALFGAALAQARPSERAQIQAKLDRANVRIASTPALHVVLTWETDESDLDLLLEAKERKESESKYEPTQNDPQLGFGPESFLVEKGALKPLRLQVQQVRRGPSGFAFGKVAIVQHDGSGKLTFDDRPFVVMNEGAAVSLGTIEPR
jgi:outer membrane protein OmpA-like peptidoglycan-associated protein